MQKKYLLLLLVAFQLVSCVTFKSLSSTTYIKANDAFILGNNVHGKFNATVTNTSDTELTIWQQPINGGQHSPITLQASSSIKVNVEKNTALKIENHSNEVIAVQLKVKGDTGLSMSYKK